MTRPVRQIEKALALRAANLSQDIRLIIASACDLLGLRWTTSGRTVYVSRRDDVAKMDLFMGPKS